MRQILMGLSPFKNKSTSYVRRILGVAAVTMYGFASVAHAQVPVTGIAKIEAGYSHTCALTISGGVKCWGDNQYGQLGVGETTRYSVTAVDVVGLQSDVIAIASGGTHSCALTAAGSVKCWGNNAAYQVGDGTYQPRYTPVSVTGLASDVIAIAATSSQSCAITSAGAVKCWGYNNLAYHTAPFDIVGLSANIVAIATGANHLCGLTNTGGVKCWGYNSYGQLGNGNTSSQSTAVDVVGLGSGVTAIGAGGSHSCALLGDGTAKCWGYNAWGQLGNNSTQNSAIPVDLPNSGDTIASLSTGYGSSCIVTINGSTKCWGLNTSGQLGNNTTVNNLVIGDVFGLGSGVSVADVGNGHACSLGNTGTVNCWGDNSYGKLGDGTTLQRLIPSPANSVNSTLPLSCPAIAVSIGVNTSGTWGDAGDCTSGIRGSAFKTDAYTFSGQAGRRIVISVTRTGSFNPYIYLRDANGRVIAEDDDGYYNPVSTSTPDARIPAKWGYFTLPALGTYTIEVTSSTEALEQPSASYTLSLTSDTANPSSSSSSAANVCNPVAISGFGIANSGSLVSGDCTLGARGTSYYTDRYSFNGIAGQQVAISLNSTAFDAYVYLKGVSGTVLTSNDDGGGSGNSRIPATSGYYTLPATGTYIVEATSYGTLATGAYAVTVSTTASSSSSSMLSSSRASSSLASASSSFSSNSSLSSASSVGSSLGVNSSSSSSFSSTASSSSSAAAGCSTVGISAGTTYNYSLSATDCTNGIRGTSYDTDRYSFSAVSGQQISIQLNSSAFDTFVYLKNSSGTLTFNDDSGGTTNSRIPVTSGFYTVPTTGVYEIEVTSYATLRTGSYSLLLTQQ